MIGAPVGRVKFPGKNVSTRGKAGAPAAWLSVGRTGRAAVLGIDGKLGALTMGLIFTPAEATVATTRRTRTMTVSDKDKDILRGLAARKAEISALDVHEEKAALWTRLNDLEKTRPLVWINEVCWNEMNVDDELTLRCEGDWARRHEDGLRKELYQWAHFPGDMIVSGHIASPMAITETGLGLRDQADIARTDETSNVVSRHFHPQIVEPEDIEKIENTVVTHDTEATERNYQLAMEVFGQIMPVRKVGLKGGWFSPWDLLIRWWGVQEAMMDLVLRPKMVNDIMARMVDVHCDRLDQWEAMNLLTMNDDNTRVGSGAYGYTKELPGEDYDPACVRPRNMWGCATAQIFSGVSPEMHWQFALRHEMRWLERWGLTYYGCCEPLDIKMEILRKIPNLRKVSMSPWIAPARAAGEVRHEYVFSHKPSPAILAEDRWRPGQARRQLVEVLEQARHCRVELIMKDISTVRYEPQRLWQWETVAMEVAEQFE